jgi:hypothetical protein
LNPQIVQAKVDAPTAESKAAQQSFRPAEFGGRGMSFNICRGTLGDKNGEISRKHGNTLIPLRKHYGKDFAYGCADNEKLGDMLQNVDEPSLSKLDKDLEAGKLEGICKGSHVH